MRFSLFNGNWDLSHKVAIGSVCGNVVLGCTVLVQGIVISIIIMFKIPTI